MRVRLLLPVIAFAMLSIASAENPPVQIGTVSKGFKKFKPMNRNFVYYKPDSPAEKKIPVLIWLHGSGGDGPVESTRWAFACAQIRNHNLPLMVVEPRQSYRIGWWWGEIGILRKYLIAEHNVDPDRVYLGGSSGGAMGTWNAAFNQPNDFAALLPICGATGSDNWDSYATKLKHVPVWSFHHKQDPVVPYKTSKGLYDAFIKIGAANVKLTTLTGTDGIPKNDNGKYNYHKIKGKVFSDKEPFRWLLKQKRGQ